MEALPFAPPTLAIHLRHRPETQFRLAYLFEST